MKKIILFFPILLLLALFLTNCGQLAGENPVGVTGGNDNGYGSTGSGLWPGGGGGGGGGSIVGRWRADYPDGSYEILNFSSNGDFQVLDYDRNGILLFSFSGTYSVSGNQLTLMTSAGNVTITFSISGNTLTIFFDTGPVAYRRI
jgi:hypothetical protein